MLNKNANLFPISLEWFSKDDLYLFNEGTHFRLYERMGCHLVNKEGRIGANFAVWAPDAKQVFV
ncbi:MAG: hypothetical protein N3A64_03125, partial [Desulfobacterota bacterium]|nr:hypothetical protein [Thermodesulfobacteriota bacterium]